MKKVISKSGKIYLGDPSVLLPQYYNKWIKDLKEEDGIHVINGTCFATHKTDSGVGSYDGSDGFIYESKTGHLAIIPFELLNTDEAYEELGKILNTKEAVLEYENGDIIIHYGEKTIDSIFIPTDYTTESVLYDNDENDFEE